jgi:hypothetical protein
MQFDRFILAPISPLDRCPGVSDASPQDVDWGFGPASETGSAAGPASPNRPDQGGDPGSAVILSMQRIGDGVHDRGGQRIDAVGNHVHERGPDQSAAVDDRSGVAGDRVAGAGAG